MKMKLINILRVNNGEQYEDFDEWVAGVFTTTEAALDKGKSLLAERDELVAGIFTTTEAALDKGKSVLAERADHFVIEVWALDGKEVCEHYVERTPSGEWKIS